MHQVYLKGSAMIDIRFKLKFTFDLAECKNNFNCLD